MLVMEQIVVYSKAGCPFCSLLKMELGKRGLVYTEFDLSDDSTRQEFYAHTGTNTVPQLFLTTQEPGLTQPSGRRIGGWSEVSSAWDVIENKA